MSGDYDAKEEAEVKKELEFMKPYLNNRLEYIEEIGRKYELKNEVKIIKFYLKLTKDPYFARTHGVSQLRNFVAEIHEMSYRHPLPKGWKPKKKLKTENMGDDLLSFPSIGESYADKLRAKNREFEEWNKTQGDGSSTTEFDEWKKAHEDDPWNTTTPSANATSFENSARAPQENRNKPVSVEAKGIPDWLKDPTPVGNTEDLNKLFERRQQPESERQEPRSNVPVGYNTDQEPQSWKELGESHFGNKDFGRDKNQGHWFFDSQADSTQRQPSPAQSQPFIAPSHPQPTFMQTYPGASNAIYEPRQGVMYIPVAVPPSVPYGVQPIYSAAASGPSPSFNQYGPSHVPRQMNPREFSNPYLRNPRFSQPPSTSVRLPHQGQAYEESFRSGSPVPTATPSPSTYDPRLANNKILRTNTYEDSHRPASPPSHGGSSPPTYNHRFQHNKFPAGNSRNRYNDRFKNDGRNKTSVNYITGRRPPPLRRPTMRERMQIKAGGLFVLGQRDVVEEPSDQPNADNHDPEASRKLSEKKKSTKISPKKPDKIKITEYHRKLVRGALKKKAADKLLQQDPEEVIRVCQFLQGKSGDKGKSPQKETKKSQLQQGRWGRKEKDTPASESDKSDVTSSSSSDVGSAKSRYPSRGVSNKKIQQEKLGNQSARKRYFKQSTDDRSETRSIRSSSSSDAGSVRSNTLVQKLKNPLHKENKQKEHIGAGKKKSMGDKGVVNTPERGKQVARKKASSSGNQSRRVADESYKSGQNLVEKNKNRSDADETYDEVVDLYNTVRKSLNTFKPDFTKEGRRFVHRNDLYTNVGLGKIKLEADYTSTVVEKRECEETILEEEESDQFLRVAYPEVSLKVEEGVELQVQPDSVHDDNAFGEENEAESEFQPVVSEKEITEPHGESVEESNNILRRVEEEGFEGVEDGSDTDTESGILIGSVVSLKPNEASETLLNVLELEVEKAPSEAGTEDGQRQTSTPDEELVKDSTNTVAREEQVLEQVDGREVSVNFTDGENVREKNVSGLVEEEN